MVERQRLSREPAVVTVGYAANSEGKGIAFAAVAATDAPGVPVYLRIPFGLGPRPALQGRDVSYAAVNAVAETLLARGCRNAVLSIGDVRLANDLRERGALPAPLTVPYVALRCRLNRFDYVQIEAGGGPLGRDLVARARAEITLDIAA